MTTVIGVDGCPKGWFYFRSDDGDIRSGVAGDFAGLVEGLPPGARVFIDIPIGLIDSGSDGRECDRLARRALGSPRSSSVFSAPAFPVLAATSYDEAKSKSFEATERKLSRQAFAIVPKIKEVNEYLAANRNLRPLHNLRHFRRDNRIGKLIAALLSGIILGIFNNLICNNEP